MIKKSLIIGMMCVSFLGMSQTQCDGLTKDNVQCKNMTKSESGLCHLHNPDYKKGKCVGKTVVCSGTTKKNKPCKSKTKDLSGRCHNHRND
jgi:hypothetical protein